MISTVQLPLFGIAPRTSARHPLVTVELARIALGVDAEMVVEAIEDGRIAWAFDIACDPGSRRRELRIWRDCLELNAVLPHDPAEVITAIIGTTRVTLRGSEIERLLLCSSPHVKVLHEAGELTGHIVAHQRILETSSLSAFLARRRVI